VAKPPRASSLDDGANEEGSNQNFVSIKTAISEDNRSPLNLAGTP